MPPVSILLNLLWIFFGGLWMAAAWMIAAVLMAITIVGLPWARAAFNIGAYTLLPFGQRAVRRDSLTGQADIGTSPLGLIGNVIWLRRSCWPSRSSVFRSHGRTSSSPASRFGQLAK